MESEDDHEEYALPPSPSPAPRSKPKGPRGAIYVPSSRIPRPTAGTGSASNSEVSKIASPHHNRDASNSSILSYKGVATTAQAALSIRPVTDTSLRVVNAAESPYPTKANHFFYPSGTFDYVEGFPAIPSSIRGQRIVDVVGGENNSARSSSGSGNHGIYHHRSGGNIIGGSVEPTKKEYQRFATTTTTSNTEDNPQPTKHNLTTSDTSKVRSTHALFNNAPGPTIYDSPSFPLHNEPRLVPLSAPGSRLLSSLQSQTSSASAPYETPPGEVVRPAQTKQYSPSFNDHNDYSNFLRPSSSSSYSSGIDVDRLAMVEVDNNVNNDHLGVPPFLTPREQQRQQQLQRQQYQTPAEYGSNPTSPFLDPGTSSTSSHTSGGLGAIASVASDLQFDSTPMSIADSVDSSGTVIRKKGYTGPIPPGYYSLFPPVSSPQSDSPRYVAESNQPKRKRSTSAPLRPVSGGPLSPISVGSNSPVSPVSPEDDNSLYNTSRPRTRSRSESLWNIGNLQTPTVLVPDLDSTRSSQYTIGNQIPRKPVARSNAIKYNSFMSTIPSESEADTRSSIGLSSRARNSDMTNVDPKSATSSTIKTKEQYRRSSSALPRPDTLDDSTLPGTSATIDFSQIDTAFPMIEPVEDIQIPRRRVTSLTGKQRLDSEASLAGYASLPSRKQSNNLISPTSVYSRAEYRDSHSQTDIGVQTNRVSALLREGLPTWARYTQTSPHGQSHRSESTPGPQSPSNLDSSHVITCPNCKVRWPPEIISNTSISTSNSNQSQSQPQPQSKAVKFDATEDRNTNESQRLYYSNEGKHRETLGRAAESSPSSRRHTVGSTYGDPDSLRAARHREAAMARSRNPNGPLSSNPQDRSVFQGEEVQDQPHLRYGRAAAIKRRTVFMAPSIDEGLEGIGMTRRNLQVWCFVIGFVFPIAWWVAAVTPLPPCPSTPPASPGFEYDLEKTLGPVDQARYENARWWRNINRIMSVVGVGIIVAIIVLAVVASKMVNGQYS